MPTLLSTLYTEEAHEIICEAYTYGYPLVLMDVVRQLMLAAGKGAAQRIGINQFAHALSSIDNVIGEPGAEAGVLQSIAWLNVAKEPMVLGLPEVSQRYYAMHLMDGWMTAFATLGTRTTGARAGDFAILGPRWSGDLPGDLRVVESPTAMVWLVMALMAVGRFIEFFARSDSSGSLFGLETAQWISVARVSIAGFGAWFTSRNGARRGPVRGPSGSPAPPREAPRSSSASRTP